VSHVFYLEQIMNESLDKLHSFQKQPEVLRLADALIEDAADHLKVAHDCDCPPEATANWGHYKTATSASVELRRLYAVNQELLEVLKELQAAQEMTTYGDPSDFVWPKSEMRKPGETAWGWICEKHGLGYQGGCICCSDEFTRYKGRKDQEARFARDDALRAASAKARSAIAKATGGAA
jgi:hypothetical protein